MSSHDVLESAVGLVVTQVQRDPVGKPVVPEPFDVYELLVLVRVELDELAVVALACGCDADLHGPELDLGGLHPWWGDVDPGVIQED